MTRTLTVITGLLMLAMSGTPAQAGANCDLETVRANGSLGGNSFNVPADTRSLTGPQADFVRLQSRECQDLDEGFNRAAALGAIVEFHPIGTLPESGGLWHANVTLANGDANTSAFAGGLNLMYVSKQASGPFETINLGASAGSSFDGQDQIYALTLGINWK